MKHTHCDVIKAWADGAQIQFRGRGIQEWTDVKNWSPRWGDDCEYRVKPNTRSTWVRPYMYTGKRASDFIGLFSFDLFEQGEEKWRGDATPVNDWKWVGPAVKVWEEK